MKTKSMSLLLLIIINACGTSLLMQYLFIFGRDGRSAMKITLVKGREYITLFYFTGSYANVNILRTVKAMKKVKISNHLHLKSFLIS